jgi:hypothetical protein
LASGYDEIARSLFSEELSVVGNYELGAMIGKGTCLEINYRYIFADLDSGSYGKVYLAHHIMTRTKVYLLREQRLTLIRW